MSHFIELWAILWLNLVTLHREPLRAVHRTQHVYCLCIFALDYSVIYAQSVNILKLLKTAKIVASICRLNMLEREKWSIWRIYTSSAETVYIFSVILLSIWNDVSAIEMYSNDICRLIKITWFLSLNVMCECDVRFVSAQIVWHISILNPLFMVEKHRDREKKE